MIGWIIAGWLLLGLLGLAVGISKIGMEEEDASCVFLALYGPVLLVITLFGLSRREK